MNSCYRGAVFVFFSFAPALMSQPSDVDDLKKRTYYYTFFKRVCALAGAIEDYNVLGLVAAISRHNRAKLIEIFERKNADAIIINLPGHPILLKPSWRITIKQMVYRDV